MPATLQAALLGVVQGATEFLPASSSAHLILARAFFGFDADRFGLASDVACHAGTLFAVVGDFRRELLDMIAAIPRATAVFRGVRLQPDLPADGPPTGGHHVREENDAYARMIWLLIFGTLPAIAAGLLFKHDIEESLRTPRVAAIMLAVGALVFFFAERRGSKTRADSTLTMTEAVWIGCAQAVALVPGVSRSGITMSVALRMGLRRRDAASFIFLLAIPAILGAATSEAPHLLKAGMDGDSAMLFTVGAITSALVGYVVVRFLIRYLATHSLDVFAWYRLALAAATFVWLAR